MATNTPSLGNKNPSRSTQMGTSVPSTAATSGPRQTLEQQRAQDAWERTTEALHRAVDQKEYEKYEKAAKALPALIMNSGLMQVLAFCHEKGKAQADVAAHLRAWLARQYPRHFQSAEFSTFMQALMQAAPADYQAINAEAFAWLKWLRQMAAARNKGV